MINSSISLFRRFWQSIRAQLVFSFMIMSIIVLVSSSVLIYYGVLDILKTRSEDSTLRLFQQTEHRIQGFRTEMDKVSKLLLLNPEIDSYMNKEKDGTDYDADDVIQINGLLSQLSMLIKNYDFIASIYFLSSDGSIIGLRGDEPIVINEKDQEHWKTIASVYEGANRTLGDIIWGGPEVSERLLQDLSYRPLNEPMISVVRGFSTIYSKKWNAFVISVNESLLESMYGNLSKSSEDETFLFDDSGSIVSSSNKPAIRSKVALQLLELNDSEYGSFTEKDRQVIYYRMGETDWTLVRYVQISDLVRDVWSLRSKMMWIVIGNVTFALILSFYFIRKITMPLRRLTVAMGEVGKGRLGTTLENVDNEIGMLTRGFNRMSQSIYELVERDKAAEKEKRKIEISLLQSQLQPHFLYNTLNTIKWMAIAIQSKNIADSITFLSNLLKPIYNNPSLVWTLREEIQYLDNYIKVMNIRYGEHIVMQYQFPENLLNHNVLRFTLQPIVENAIVHGMEANQVIGTITLEGREEGDTLILIIEDKGRGIAESELQRLQVWLANDEQSLPESPPFGIGLLNVQKRIQLHFGKNYGLSIHSVAGQETQVTLVLPHKIVI
ncbi:cache domain-containing sensor histidine kinase [Cohnella abietis]|uniref:Histidine kinase n=1 Tax=Cohnella abietis TaxID=2507935 RepID=A0A3T1DCY9_9BACL|nr:sensor histidine kinase [Cohnella abietis]BBI35894.1 histidine kinase [Cohnella abietis]